MGEMGDMLAFRKFPISLLGGNRYGVIFLFVTSFADESGTGCAVSLPMQEAERTGAVTAGSRSLA